MVNGTHSPVGLLEHNLETTWQIEDWRMLKGRHYQQFGSSIAPRMMP
jgi:hypothetical protein